jgi:hypothetical protein
MIPYVKICKNPVKVCNKDLYGVSPICHIPTLQVFTNIAKYVHKPSWFEMYIYNSFINKQTSYLYWYKNIKLLHEYLHLQQSF